MTAGSYCYIGPQGIVHGTFVCSEKRKRWRDSLILINGRWDLILLRASYNCPGESVRGGFGGKTLENGRKVEAVIR